MPALSNHEIATTLGRYASLLEISGSDPFRARAFRRAAETIRALPQPIAALHAEGQLRSVPGVGAGIAAALDELIASGCFTPFEQLQRRIPIGVLELLTIPGVGAKTAARLYREARIVGLESLEAAIDAGALRALKGLGGKTEANLIAGLEALRRRTGRIPLGTALPIGRAIVAAIQQALPNVQVSLAGATRRMESTVADIDLLVGSDDPESVAGALADLSVFAGRLSGEASNLRLRHQSGIDVDLIVVPLSRFWPELVQATGSRAHLDLLAGTLPSAGTEQGVYEKLGLPWVPPEVRQGTDEFDRARAGELESLIDAVDIRGEFHCHTVWSDGKATIAEMAAAAATRGYRFLGISDHSRGLSVANGLDAARLAAQRSEIEATITSDVTLFAASEVEVARDGRLDFADEVLAQLDLVIASLHVGLRQPREILTERLIAILHNPNVDIIAHPSGRLIERREGGDFDWDRVFDVAAETGTALEINADPARLDLDSTRVRQALDAGCLLTINCDAHHPDGFRSLEYGVAVARRAWTPRDHVLNCWDVDAIRSWLAKRGETSR